MATSVSCDALPRNVLGLYAENIVREQEKVIGKLTLVPSDFDADQINVRVTPGPMSFNGVTLFDVAILHRYTATQLSPVNMSPDEFKIYKLSKLHSNQTRMYVSHDIFDVLFVFGNGDNVIFTFQNDIPKYY